MARRDSVRVTGYRELLRACDNAGRDIKRETRGVLREAGDVVRERGAELFQPYSARSAAGYRVRVRQRGVSVEQSLRKTTGKRPKFGALQMTKALLPALDDEGEAFVEKLEGAMDTISERFSH
jgi:hypothetical protein